MPTEADWRPVEGLLARAVAHGVVPGCAISVVQVEGESVHERFCQCFGVAQMIPERRATTIDTPWDLASLTKVLGTTPLAMALVGQGVLALDAEVNQWVPAAPSGVTVAHCLHHSSGLPAWLPLFQSATEAGQEWGAETTRAWMVEQAVSAPIEAVPGVQHRYSDLGFLCLGAVMEAVGGDRLDRLWERHVRAPSGLDLRWGWQGQPVPAATEDCPVRGRVVVGDVHDLNAAAMGGVSAHAGLFGSVGAVSRAAAWQLSAFLGARNGLEPVVVRRFVQTRGPGSHWLGWDGVSPNGSAGARWPSDGFGHLGFTGCAVWVAPRQRTVVAFTSNRVHPEVEGGAVPDAPLGPRTKAYRALRPLLFTAVVEALDGGGHWRDA